MNATTVTSEAYNLSSISSAVNDRTGGVDVSVSLGRISCGLQDPATFELMIYSNPGNPSSNYYGFGGNWIINSPRIDFRNQVIYFGNGKSARYTDNFLLEYNFIKDLNIERKHIVDGSVSYWNTIITYKNGTVEYYNELGVITQLFSASGHCLNFSYESAPGETYQALSKVYDGYGNELLIDYGVAPPGSTERVVTVTQLCAGERSTTKVYIQRNINQDIVKSISLPNNHNQRFYFDYTVKEDRLVYLSRITKPTGQAQEFTYSSINYNNSQTVYVVSKLEIMGNDPVRSDKATVTYEYSSNNFTGYPLVKNQVAGRDNCIYRDDDFTYSVTEGHDDIKIKRTFNRFHLLIEEEHINALSGVRHSLTSFIYPTVEGVDINGQPENFSLWARKTTLYTNASGGAREVFETRSFDVFGNLLSHRDASGVITTNTYYPADSSQEDGCPPTQHGFFVCHLKRSVNKPEIYTGEMKTLEFKYKEVLGLPYISPVLSTPPTVVRPYMVRAVESKANGVTLSTADYIAATDETTANARIFVGMQAWEKLPSQNKPYTITYTYSKVMELARIQTSYRSSDVEETLEKTSSRTFSLCSGLTYEEQDFNGAITQYQYDAENRLVKKTNFSGTAWQQEEHYSYEYYKNIDATYGYQNVITTTKANGMQLTSYINFNNQLSYSLETRPQGAEYCIKKLQYFPSGLIASETAYDKVLYPSGAEVTVNNTTRYTYVSRELVRILNPDETTDTIVRNKVLNTEDHQRRNGAIYRVAYDNAGNITSLALITHDQNNEIVTYLEQTTYDGFGRTSATVNRTGGRSSYDYDHFDRLLRKTVHDSDGNGRVDTNIYTYDSALQNMNLPTSVISRTSLNTQQEVILNSRRYYDGFGRLIEQDNQTFSYAQPYYTHPSRCSDTYDAANTLTTFDPITLMTNTVVKTLAQTPETRLNYSYDRQTGLITQAQAVRSGVETANFQYSYDAKGALTQTRRTYANGTSVTTEKTYSVSGERVMTATNHLGKLQRYHYDDYGRLWVKQYEGLGIKLVATYRLDGTLYRITVESNKFLDQDRYLAIMYFEYDAFNFESRRELAVCTNGSMTTVLDTTTVHGNNQLVTSRNLSKGEASTDNIDYAYTYLGAYGHLRSSNLTKGTSAPSVTNYNFAGGQRFSTIEVTDHNPLHYGYREDRVDSLNNGESTRLIRSDFAGNIIDSPEAAPYSRHFVYDASNSLISCHTPNDNQTFQYLYEPLGNLSQILSDNESITYIYDDDTVIGEISGNTKTLYLSFGNMLLGRYIQRGDQEELELFGTDTAGTVRSVTKCLPGGTTLQTVYHDYSDFGERRAW
ncbi:RHS repeat protein [Pseudomonas sp. NFIX28]|uniref:RHS repeat protein n=1 Tax=Pseudomonas sp. NFIX28 TaxID=1566235 RepID=UPI00089A4CDB|nr:RHS repeat protein [Pseudomonas sp. NFIX28]SDY38190.1 YD repeat-containing protein [Pseudomonas sp. NFIX28]